VLSPPEQAAAKALLLKLGTDRDAIDEKAIGLVNQDKYANGVVFIE
jgi:methyl coenzyme M reductase subunit D